MKILRNIVLLLLIFNCAQVVSAQVQQKKPTLLNHIALYVIDLDVSTTFYRDIIGLDTIPEPFHDGRHTWFSVGQGHLHIISGAENKPVTIKHTHLCFTVPSVSEFIKILEKHDIEYENWAGEKYAVTDRVDGIQQVYFQDPDGYWIEINDDYAATAGQ